MNEIKDLTGLGEPAAELIKAVRAAVGDVFRPWQIRREARAKADETRIQAGADSELFTQVASYVWWFDDTGAHLLTFGELPFDLSVRNHLETIGLLEDTGFPGLLWGAPAGEYSLRHHNRVYRMALEADLDR